MNATHNHRYATVILQVTPGSCDRSFGIHVARVANFPAHVVSEAERIAVALESGEPLQAHFAKSGKRERTVELSVQAQPLEEEESTCQEGGDNGEQFCDSNGSESRKRKVAVDSHEKTRALTRAFHDGPVDKRSR